QLPPPIRINIPHWMVSTPYPLEPNLIYLIRAFFFALGASTEVKEDALIVHRSMALPVGADLVIVPVPACPINVMSSAGQRSTIGQRVQSAAPGGYTAQKAQSFIDDIVQTELKNVRLSQYPQYDPSIPRIRYGEALPGRYTRIGPLAIEEGRRETLVTIVHEEMHHRVYARGWRMPRHLEEAYVERIAQRFARIKGWP
ncbi:MAG: hypothetical protein ACPLRM_06260, partial [Anaerolineae bacterium]